MAEFQRCYFAYRRLGFSRFDSLRFAWMVAAVGMRPMPLRVKATR